MRERLLTTNEAAEALRLSPRTLHTKRGTGDGPPFVKLGGSIRYRESDLERYVADRVRVSTSDDGRDGAAA